MLLDVDGRDVKFTAGLAFGQSRWPGHDAIRFEWRRL
jgi:hypothetical protein